MIVKRLLQINLLVSTFIAMAFILAPKPALALYGISGGESLYVITQYFGATHVAFAVLLWLALKAEDARFLRFIVTSFFFGDLTGTIVLLAAQLGGAMNNTGWVLVGFSLLFATGYGYGALKKLPAG
ncbi:MAG: hypothetical protein JW757_07890 [Anaerolineales bacterium]|nr:hypothetical protein [Anaerolineales bacterium]